MTIRDILVHVDDEQNTKTLEVALRLAGEFSAHLTAIYVKDVMEVPMYAEVSVPQSVLDQAEEAEKNRLLAVKEKFEQTTSGYDTKVDWRQDEGQTAPKLIEHSACYDLVVVKQSGPAVQGGTDAKVAERVVLESGRPVLVVPHTDISFESFAKVVIAWNGKKEAVRAIHDAMPILERAQVVGIASAKTPSGEEVPCADIAKHLARHGANVEIMESNQDIVDVGNWLQVQIDENESDLVVMGAYGHSRYREMIFGGVTRHMLRNMTVPCLMSH